MFRGSATLSSAQLMDAVSVTGGDFDAQTQATVTRYVFTVPSADVDIALRAERSRSTGLLVAPDQWNQERRAITQEVQQDNSNAFYRLFVQDAGSADRRNAVRQERPGHGRRLRAYRHRHANTPLLRAMVPSE